MLSPDRLAEAGRLARPCVLLKPSKPTETLAAIWGGPGVVPPPPGPFRHWLSIDCQFLPPEVGPTAGVISVYTDEDDCESGTVCHDPDARLLIGGGLGLSAECAVSIPPPDALSAAGDEDYLRYWQKNCPLYGGQAFAVLGGWHFPWPDDDWEELGNGTLLVWTIEDAEPWVEVWGGPRTDGEERPFQVVQRVT